MNSFDSTEQPNNRKLKIPLLSVIELPSQQKTHDSLRQRDLEKKEKMKGDAEFVNRGKTNYPRRLIPKLSQLKLAKELWKR